MRPASPAPASGLVRSLGLATFQTSTASAALPLNEDQIRVTDQVVFRFGRLQDAISPRLLPAMLQLMQEWQNEAPFVDKLNRAEKLGLIPSALQWQELREIRNQTAHEYPAQPELLGANLRNLMLQVPAQRRRMTNYNLRGSVALKPESNKYPKPYFGKTYADFNVCCHQTNRLCLGQISIQRAHQICQSRQIIKGFAIERKGGSVPIKLLF